MIVPLPRSGPIWHIPLFISINYHKKRASRKITPPVVHLIMRPHTELLDAAHHCSGQPDSNPHFHTQPTLPPSSNPSLQSVSELTADGGRWMVHSGGSSGSTRSSWTDEWLDGFGARFEYQQEKCQRPHSERVHIFSPLHETSHRLVYSLITRQMSGFNCMDRVLTKFVTFS